MDKAIQKKLLTVVKNNYQQIAYEFSLTRDKALWPELLKLCELVKENDNILDVGCGNGRLWRALKNKNVKYTGIDNCSKLIQLAKKKYSNDDVSFLIDDIISLNNVPNNNFNIIFCIAVLHHIPGKKLRIEALQNLKKKLKKNGKIIITVWNLWQHPKHKNLIIKFALLKLLGKNKMDFGDIVFNWKGKKSSQRYYHAFTKKGLIELAKKTNLHIEKIYKDKYNYYLILTK